MRGLLYEVLSVALVAGSLFFFYQSTAFLTEADYLSATLTLFIGFTVARVALELARLAVIARREE